MKPVNQEPIRVVAHVRGGKLIKGQLNLPALKDLDALKQQPTRLPDNVAVQPAGSPDTVEIGVDSLKALFFVKNYEGRTDYKEFKYFKFTPQVEGLWVRITFYDNERTEGVIHNSMQFLVDPGFFIKPPDPESNNEMAYVIKNSLVEFRVLGVKSSY